MEIRIRGARSADLDQCVEMEHRSFPEAEAAPRSSIGRRLRDFPQGFLVAEADGRLVGMINSGATHSDDISDEAFKALEGHDPEGANLVVFSVCVLPEHRSKGIGARLLAAFLDLAREQERRAVLLICKAHMQGFYESCGFALSGPSACAHGGASWLEMRHAVTGA